MEDSFVRAPTEVVRVDHPVVGPIKKQPTAWETIRAFAVQLSVLGLVVLLGFQIWWMTLQEVKAVQYPPSADTTTIDAAAVVPQVPVEVPSTDLATDSTDSTVEESADSTDVTVADEPITDETVALQ